MAEAAVHAAKLAGAGGGGNGPEDPRNHWKGELKAMLKRAKDVVESRLKNLTDQKEEYLRKIQEIADKGGVTLD
jgi:hypothetical protein